MSSLRPRDGATVVVPNTEVRRADGSTVGAVLVAAGTESAGNRVVVLVAEPLTSVDAATGTLLFYLLFGVPILILVTGRRHLPRRGAGPAAGRGHPCARGRDDGGPRRACRCPRARRGRPAGRDDERDARPAAGRARPCSAASSRTPATSCAARSRRSPPAWSCCARGDRRPATRSPPCAARPSGWAGWSTPCCCWPAPTRAACGHGSRTSTSTRWPRRSGCGRQAGSSPRIEAAHGAGGRRPRAARAGGAQPRRQRPPARPVARSWSRSTRDGDIAVLDVADDGPGRARPTSGRGCSSGSSASTTPARARTAAPGWAWRSSRRSWPRTAAPWTSSTARWAGRCSGCGCRCRPTTVAARDGPSCRPAAESGAGRSAPATEPAAAPVARS